MKTMNDAKWELMLNGVHALILLNDGYKISIIMSIGSCGGDEGLWELGVFKDDDYSGVDLPSVPGGVKGWLEFSKLEELIEKVQADLKLG